MEPEVEADERTRRSIFGAGSATLVANGSLMAIGFATGVLTARGLPPSERGVFVVLVLSLGTIGTLVLAGMDETQIWRARGSRSEALRVSAILATRRRWFATSGCVAMILLALVLQRELSLGSLAVAALAAFIVPLNSLTQVRLAALRASGAFGLWNAIRCVPQAVYLIGLSLLVATDSLTVVGAVGLLVGANVLTSCAATLASGQPTVTSELDHDERRRLARYGYTILLAQAPLILSQRADQFLLAILTSPHQLGLYTVAVSLGALVTALGTTTEQVLFPRILHGSTTAHRGPQMDAGVALLGIRCVGWCSCLRDSGDPSAIWRSVQRRWDGCRVAYSGS